MDRTFASLMFALAGALTLGMAGCGHPPNNQQQPPAPEGTAQLPPQPPYTTAQPSVSTEQPASNTSAALGGQTPGFPELAGSKGYITRQDARRVPWLENHFSQCDANGDGRITREEYSRCRQGPAQNRTMQQPPAPPPRSGSSSG